jgi:hypothetical protein
MGLWQRFTAPWRKDTSTAANPTSWFVDWVRGGDDTTAGVVVSPETAMRLSCGPACASGRRTSASCRASSIAGCRAAARNGRRSSALRPDPDQPNPLQTAFEFKQLMQAQLDLRGNAYGAQGISTAAARHRAVAVCRPGCRCCAPRRARCSIASQSQASSRQTRSRRGRRASARHVARRLRRALADRLSSRDHRACDRGAKYGAAFFGNSAQPQRRHQGAARARQGSRRGAARASGKRSSAASRTRTRSRSSTAAWSGRPDRHGQHRRAVHRDAQMQNQEIWRIYRMPPHKVGDLDKATFSNIEQQALEYVTDCLMSELVRWEQTLARPADRGRAKNTSSNSCRRAAARRLQEPLWRLRHRAQLGLSQRRRDPRAREHEPAARRQGQDLPAAAQHGRGRHAAASRRPPQRPCGAKHSCSRPDPSSPTRRRTDA